MQVTNLEANMIPQPAFAGGICQQGYSPVFLTCFPTSKCRRREQMKPHEKGKGRGSRKSWNSECSAIRKATQAGGMWWLLHASAGAARAGGRHTWRGSCPNITSSKEAGAGHYKKTWGILNLNREWKRGLAFNGDPPSARIFLTATCKFFPLAHLSLIYGKDFLF